MKRALALLAALYLLAAAGSGLAERFGALACGCADECWCRRPGLNRLRWVFPWHHLPRPTPAQKKDLGSAHS